MTTANSSGSNKRHVILTGVNACRHALPNARERRALMASLGISPRIYCVVKVFKFV